MIRTYQKDLPYTFSKNLIYDIGNFKYDVIILAIPHKKFLQEKKIIKKILKIQLFLMLKIALI